MSLLALYSSRSRPIVGMASGVDLFATPDGFAYEHSNVRRVGPVWKARNGHYQIGSSAIASGSFRGSFSCKGPDGSDYVFVAIASSSKVRIYGSVNNLVSFTEFTNSSGAYGDSRLTDTGEYVHWAMAYDQPSGMHRVVVQNGVDYPRMIAFASPPLPSYYSAGAVHQPIAWQNRTSTPKAMFKLPVSFTISGGSMPTYTNSGANFVLASSGSSPNNFPRLTVGTSTATNDTAKLSAFSGGARDVTNCPELYFLYDTSDETVWDNLKIEILDTATWTEIWNGSDAKYLRKVVPFDYNSSRAIAGLLIDHVSDRNAISEIRFTWIGTSAPSAAITLDLLMVAGAGKVEAGTQFGATLFCLDSLAESPGLVFENVGSQRIADLGGPLLGGARFPTRSGLSFSVDLTYLNVSLAQVAAGVSRIRFYVLEPGDLDFAYFSSATVAAYSGGSWSASGTANTQTTTTISSIDPSAKMRKWTLPGEEHQCIPIGKAMANVGGRLFVGAKTTSTFGKLMISALDLPTRFYVDAPDADDETAALSEIYDSESIERMYPIANVSGALQTCLIFTDRSVTAKDGVTRSSLSRRMRVAEMGTQSPWSVAAVRGDVFFLDTEMRVRRIVGGQASDISSNVVDDQFQGIPASRRPFVSGVSHDECYKVAFTASGGSTNNRIGVYSLDDGAWWAIDRLNSPVTAEQLISSFDSTVKSLRLYTIGSDNKPYELEKSGQSVDHGTSGIAIVLTYGGFGVDFLRSFFVDRVGVVMDKQSTGSLTTTRTYYPGPKAASGAMAMTSSDGWIRRWDSPSGTPDPSAMGIAATLSLSGTVAGGTAFREVVAEIVETNQDADVA